MSMISEQIEELRLMAEMFVNGEPYGNLLRRAANTIAMLSEKARADRPQGHWTKTDVATYRCSECGKIQIADDDNELNFCCCCGSRNKVRRLKGADDE